MKTTTTEALDADLDDEMWTWLHIARFLHRGKSATFSITALPGFPDPVGCVGDWLWPAAEVRAFVLDSREQSADTGSVRSRAGRGSGCGPTTVGKACVRKSGRAVRHA